MALTVDHLTRTVETLDRALHALQHPDNDEIQYDLYRNAATRSFGLSLETSGKLLRKALKAYSGDPRAADRLVFNDVLREAGKHGLLDPDSIERWLGYRSNRNTTAHDYGEGFANDTLLLLPAFVDDVRRLAAVLREHFDAADH